MKLAQDLRRGHVTVLGPFPGRSLKSQLRLANTLGAGYTVILGQKELSSGNFILKDMAAKKQREVPEGELAGLIRKISKG